MIIDIKLKLSELIYDIKSTAYTIADSITSGNVKAIRNLKDICEDNNYDRVIRIIELKVAICRELLNSYTRRPVSQNESFFNNTEKMSKVYVLHMNVPDDYSETTADLITKLIHEYIVYSVVAEWLGNVGLGSDETYRVTSAKVTAIKDHIKEAFTSRRTTHRRLSPF